MTAKHQTPEWRKTCRIIRAQVTQQHQRGNDVDCWRCGGPITPDMRYDIGHITRDGGEGIDNAAPEHRTKTGPCIGNRNHGGRIGARITNTHKGRATFQGPSWA